MTVLCGAPLSQPARHKVTPLSAVNFYRKCLPQVASRKGQSPKSAVVRLGALSSRVTVVVVLSAMSKFFLDFLCGYAPSPLATCATQIHTTLCGQFIIIFSCYHCAHTMAAAEERGRSGTSLSSRATFSVPHPKGGAEHKNARCVSNCRISRVHLLSDLVEQHVLAES